MLRLFTTQKYAPDSDPRWASSSDSEAGEPQQIRAAQQGSRTAFDALARQYTPLLRGFLMRRVGQGADDVLQETLLAAWAALPRFSRRARFKAWLFAIAAHKCADHHRAQAHTPEIPLHLVENEPDTRHDAYATADSQQAIRHALALLPAEQRDVLELYYYAELTLAEVAHALNRNVNTVKYQFYRGHARVEQELRDEGPRPPQPEPSSRSRKVPHRS